MAGNCLKNKPWKVDQKLTDIPKFTYWMNQSYLGIIIVCVKGFSMTGEDIYDMYFKKSEVNKFRQRSGY
jgi:hypothetical protein